MIIRYELFDDFRGWQRSWDFFLSCLSKYPCRRILEVGSGANPTLTPEYVRENALHYVTSDIDENELAKADAAFERLVIDLSGDIDPALFGGFDCVLSRMVGEHIQDGEKYHRNIFDILRPGGISVHCFSTLWTVPFAANYLLPESLTDLLLKHFMPRDEHKHGKFKAYYSWSRGPSKTMIDRFHSMGFEIVEYIGYFGHSYYRKRLPWIDPLERMKSRFLLHHPVPQLTSYATIVLRKPE